MVIAGAGIAGCAAATMYGRQGLRVALLETHRDPSTFKRTCTHFIQPSALPAMQRLGLDRRIAGAGGVRNSVDFWTPYGWIDAETMTAGYAEYGYNIRRSVLDPMLRETAAGTPGVDLLLGYRVVDVLRQGSRVTGLVADDADGTRHELHGRLVVGADGRRSLVADRSGLPAKTTRHGRFGYFAHYRGARLQTNASSQIWLDGVGANYAFSNDADRIVFLAMRPKEELATFRQDLEGNLLSSFARLPKAPQLDGAERVSAVVGVIDYPGELRRAAGDGVALVGDAAIVADYLWGVGCGWALQTAEWLVDATAEPLLRGHDVSAGAQRYARMLRRRLGPHYMLISDYASGRPFNALERLLYPAATIDAQVAQAFGRVGGRLSSPARLLSPAMLARMARARRRAAIPAASPARPGLLEGDRGEPEARWPDSVVKPTVSAVRTELSVQGVRTPLLTAGNAGAEEAAVFVHGNPGAGEEFLFLIEAVSEFGRALAPDMPGYGRAGKPEDFDYTVSGYARHLQELLDQQRVHRAHLVLHDFGGMWGLAWAAEHPDRVGSVTLLNTGILLNYRWHYLAKIWRTPGAGEAFMAGATKPAVKLLLRHGNPRGLPDPFLDRMWRDYDRGTRRAVLKLYRATPDPAGLARRLHAMLRPLGLPALVVWGARDPYLHIDLAYRQRETFPGADVIILADSGHWPYADNPEAVATAVVPFLRRQFS